MSVQSKTIFGFRSSAIPATAALLFLSALFLLPFLWMVSTSLKPLDQTMTVPPTWLPRAYYLDEAGKTIRVRFDEKNCRIPEEERPGGYYRVREWRQVDDFSSIPQVFEVKRDRIRETIKFEWGNYRQVFRKIPFLVYLRNTLILAVLGVLGVLFSNTLVAYGFSKILWRGRDKFFYATMATMMIPFPVTMIPLFVVFKKLGMTGTLMPLWVPAFFGSAFNIFLLRQFFLRIPKDISEAATLDGAGEFTIFWRIYVPLAAPALAVVALFHFIWAWNDFLGPLLYLTDQNTFTLSLGLQFYQSQHGGTQWHLLMAASTLTVLPVVILFFLTQRTFLRGITFMKNVDVN